MSSKPSPPPKQEPPTDDVIRKRKLMFEMWIAEVCDG